VEANAAHHRGRARTLASVRDIGDPPTAGPGGITARVVLAGGRTRRASSSTSMAAGMGGRLGSTPGTRSCRALGGRLRWCGMWSAWTLPAPRPEHVFPRRGARRRVSTPCAGVRPLAGSGAALTPRDARWSSPGTSAGGNLAAVLPHCGARDAGRAAGWPCNCFVYPVTDCDPRAGRVLPRVRRGTSSF